LTLTPRGKLTASKPEELIVNVGLVTDTLGREIDGNDDGQPGSDFVGTISGSRVTAGGLPLARAQSRPAAVPAVIDALLARGELTGLRDILQAVEPLARITRMRRDHHHLHDVREGDARTHDE
jgi:hypothetical protein